VRVGGESLSFAPGRRRPVGDGNPAATDAERPVEVPA